MLPRPSQRSIFHLGEEGGYDVHDHRGAGAGAGDEHAKSTTDASATRHDDRGRRDHGRHHQRRKRDAAAADATGGVGLQILVRHPHSRHHARAPPPPQHSHIVLKQQVVLLPAARHRGSFLRACSRCRRELSPSKDVYMYRGDQGFCSEECRWRQMLSDEAREYEAVVKKERMRRGLHQPHHLRHGPRPPPPPAIRGAARRLVAVAY